MSHVLGDSSRDCPHRDNVLAYAIRCSGAAGHVLPLRMSYPRTAHAITYDIITSSSYRYRDDTPCVDSADRPSHPLWCDCATDSRDTSRTGPATHVRPRISPLPLTLTCHRSPSRLSVAGTGERSPRHRGLSAGSARLCDRQPVSEPVRARHTRPHSIQNRYQGNLTRRTLLRLLLQRTTPRTNTAATAQKRILTIRRAP